MDHGLSELHSGINCFSLKSYSSEYLGEKKNQVELIGVYENAVKRNFFVSFYHLSIG